MSILFTGLGDDRRMCNDDAGVIFKDNWETSPNLEFLLQSIRKHFFIVNITTKEKGKSIFSLRNF